MISDESGIEIISLLFRLLEFENDSVITVLFSALESLRTAFQDSSDDIGPLIWFSLLSDFFSGAGQTLKLLIQGSRASELARKRMIALSWSKTLFGWSSITIESMLYLACERCPLPLTPLTLHLLLFSGDHIELVNSFALSEMKKLDLHIREHANRPDGLFPKSSCEVVFSTLLKVREISGHVMVPPQRSQYRKVLKELFSIANSILESCTSVELREFDGLVPFVGPPQWPTVQSQLVTHSSSPPFDFLLLSHMAAFLSTGTFIESNEDQDLIGELSKLSRNLCLLGDDRTVSIFHSHLNTLLHWIEIETSQPHFLSQTIGLLSLKRPGHSSNHVSNIWRILQHKIQSSSDNAKARSLACSTAMLVALLPIEQNSETLHMLNAHWDTLHQHAFASTDSHLSSQALESIGSLGSLGLSFPHLLSQIKTSFVEVVDHFHSLILSRSNDPSALCPALQALSRILSPETCPPGLL
jgi:hypothetical protein